MIKIANNLVKLADITQDAAGFLNPSSSNVQNYVGFGIGGGSIGALTGLLIEALRDKKEKNYLKALLAGGGIGSILGVGAKAIGDISVGSLGEKERNATAASIIDLLPAKVKVTLPFTALDRWDASRKGDLSAWDADWIPHQISNSEPRPESEQSKNDSNKSKSEPKK